MNLTDEQYEEMKKVFEMRCEYTEMVKEHNSAKSEVVGDA